MSGWTVFFIILTIVLIIVSVVFIYLYFTKICQPCRTCPLCPICPVTESISTNLAYSKNCRNYKSFPIIPDTPLNNLIGLPGINFPLRDINSEGRYGIMTVDNNSNIIVVDSKNQNQGWGFYSIWQVINEMSSDNVFSMYYIYDTEYNQLPFFENLTGGNSVNWINANPDIALPMYSNMAINTIITNTKMGISTNNWIAAPGPADAVTIVISKDGEIVMYTDYGVCD